jgi:exopolyphosphatase/guanosine-5'-triphosphate,3'-diphosphate pyrophosphatase
MRFSEGKMALVPTMLQREFMPGIDPRRADVILAVALLLRCIADRAHVPEILVSDRGIQWGLFFERAAAAAG